MNKESVRPFMLYDYAELANDLDAFSQYAFENAEEGTPQYRMFQNVCMLACEGLQTFAAALNLDLDEALEAQGASQQGLYTHFTYKPEGPKT